MDRKIMGSTSLTPDPARVAGAPAIAAPPSKKRAGPQGVKRLRETVSVMDGIASHPIAFAREMGSLVCIGIGDGDSIFAKTVKLSPSEARELGFWLVRLSNRVQKRLALDALTDGEAATAGALATLAPDDEHRRDQAPSDPTP